jgi:hypothetical protein
LQVVDDFSSKLGLPRTLETVESIDANHMQIARYCSKDDPGYRAVSGVLKRFILKELSGRVMLTVNDANVSENYRVLQCRELVTPNLLVPFPRDGMFIGREDVIADIDKTFNRATLQSHVRLALVGLGGVG